MRAYRPAFDSARTVSELAALAREIYAEDLENGYVTVLGEMVGGGMSDPRARQRGGGPHRALDRHGEAQDRSPAARIDAGADGPAAGSGVRDHRALPGHRHAQPSRRRPRPARSRCWISASATRRWPARCSPPSNRRAGEHCHGYRAGSRHRGVQLLGRAPGRAAARVRPPGPNAHLSSGPPASAARARAGVPVPLRRPGGADAQPRGHRHALQHLLGPLRPRRRRRSPTRSPTPGCCSTRRAAPGSPASST